MSKSAIVKTKVSFGSAATKLVPLNFKTWSRWIPLVFNSIPDNSKSPKDAVDDSDELTLPWAVILPDTANESWKSISLPSVTDSKASALITPLAVTLPLIIKCPNEPVPSAVTLFNVDLSKAPEICKFSVVEPEPMKMWSIFNVSNEPPPPPPDSKIISPFVADDLNTVPSFWISTPAPVGFEFCNDPMPRKSSSPTEKPDVSKSALLTNPLNITLPVSVAITSSW